MKNISSKITILDGPNINKIYFTIQERIIELEYRLTEMIQIEG